MAVNPEPEMVTLPDGFGIVADQVSEASKGRPSSTLMPLSSNENSAPEQMALGTTVKSPN